MSNVILATKEDGERVLDYMNELLTQYSVVSLADFYDLVGLPSTHADSKMGWVSLENCEVKETNGGYMIDLPAMEAI